MNPARSLGPALASGDLGTAWIYIAGPLAGAPLAVALAWVLRGPPSPAAATAAQGSIGSVPRGSADGAPAQTARHATTVVVTDAQVEAAKMIAARDKAAGHETSGPISKITHAVPKRTS